MYLIVIIFINIIIIILFKINIALNQNRRDNRKLPNIC